MRQSKATWLRASLARGDWATNRQCGLTKSVPTTYVYFPFTFAWRTEPSFADRYLCAGLGTGIALGPNPV